jgi:large repetitive protein
VPANTTFNAGASTAGWVCAPDVNAGSTCTLAVGGIAGGGGSTATFAVTAASPLPAGVTQISNTASIADDGANGTDTTPGNNSGSDTTPVTGAPDLSITKSDGGVSVAPGDTAAYTLTYANSGNRGATGVVITETVPANTTFNAGASTAGWVCAPNGNAGSTCTLAVGGVAGGGGSTATFAVTFASPLPAGVTQISNTASIADDGANGTDPTSGNNSSSDTTPVTGAPDLSITKDDGGTTATPGSVVAYTLTYSNTGNVGASGVVLTETVPANTTFNAGASTAGWACAPDNNAGSTCTFAIGAVAGSSGSLTATFAVTVANPVAAGVTQISNTASVADDGSSGVDPTPGNNSGSDTTPVTAAPDLSLTKSDGGTSVVPGGTVAYTLTYANGGDQGAAGVVLTETVPANTTFNSGASTAGWSCSPNDNAGSTCTLAVGGLAGASGSQMATFAVTAVNPLPAGVTQISNTASIADDGANGTDPTPGNNSGSDTTPVTSAPDLSITKDDGGTTTMPGSVVAYTLTYSNTGNVGASGVVLTETVPANTTFNSGASTAGWSCSPDDAAGSTCTLAVGGLAAGSGDQTATFAVTLNHLILSEITEISNTASIADDGANGTDPTPANNSDSDTTPIVGLDFYSVEPCRLVDTRISGGALTSGEERSIPVASQCGIPADAVAVAVNVTAFTPSSSGNAMLYPTPGGASITSVLNFQAGQVRANNAFVTLADDGSIQARFNLNGGGMSHLIIDLVGYFK